MNALLLPQSDALEHNLTCIAIGDWQIDLLRRHGRGANQREACLTAGEFALLLGLLERRGQPVPRAALLRLLHPGQAQIDVDPRTIDTLVVRLRRKLERDPAHPRLIQTLYGKGYRLAEEHELTSRHAPSPELAG